MTTPPSEHPPAAHAGTLPRTIGPYSPAVATGGLLFLSGQVGKLPGTTRVEGTITEQTTACLTNLAAVLASKGLDYASLVKCNVFLVDIADLDAMNDAYAAVLGHHRPARTTIAAAALPLGARVEIEAIAQRRDPAERGFPADQP